MILIPDMNPTTEPGLDPGPLVFYGSGLGKMISAASGIRLGWDWMGMGSGNFRQVRQMQIWLGWDWVSGGQQSLCVTNWALCGD